MIIVLDLDDTLLDADGQIPKANKLALKNAQEKGHKIVISTLRSFPRCKSIADEIKADYISCFLGNLCVDLNGKILKANTLPFNNYDEIIEDFSNIFQGWIGFESDKISVIADKDVAAQYQGVTFLERTDAINTLKRSKVFKLSFQCKEDPQIISQFKSLAESLDVDHKFSRSFRYVDLFPKNTDKVETLKFFKSKFKDEKIIVFGDNMVDKKSIEFADIGVCMANGLDEVKSVADIVADTNTNAGVAKVLNEIIK